MALFSKRSTHSAKSTLSLTDVMTSFSVLSFFMAISIASLNVNGIAEAPKRQRVFTSLLASGFNVFMLQEMHFASVGLGKSWEQEWGVRAVWSPGTNRSAGVALLVHPKCSVEISDFRVEVAGRVLTVKPTLDGKPFQIINVYAPNLALEREILSIFCGPTLFATSTLLLSGILIAFLTS